MMTNMKRWLSMLLAAMLLTTLIPAALSEDAAWEASLPDVTAAPVDAAVPAEAGEVELDLGDDAPQASDESALSPEIVELELAEGMEMTLEQVPEKACAYARTVSDPTVVYADAALAEPVFSLQSSEPVLVVERLGELVRATFTCVDGDVEGYVLASDIAEMSPEQTDKLLDDIALIGYVTLYQDDVDWPLPIVTTGVDLAAADFTRQGNDTEFVVQGKTITARMVGDHSDCWSWARALYKIIWGVKFDSTFVGTPATGHNLIRNLTDEERQLTGANLKRFLAQSELGCTLRICSCPRNCSNIDHDGCSKHEKHSLIVVSVDDNGFVVMDNVTGNGTDRYDTRYYTYENFAKHWAKYKMIKYIKWPNAPEYDKSKDLAEAGVKPESVSLSETSIIMRAEQSLPLTATVLPENAADRSVTWTSSDPFVAYMDNGSLMAVASGKTTVTATTANGLTAIAEVAVVDKDYKATGVTLDQTGTVYLNVGGTLQLNATVSPAYANPEVAWKSSNKKVATVSSTGLVTAKKAGTATIAVRTASKKTAKVKVKVLKGDSAGSVTLDQTGTVSLNVGETLKLNATVTPANAKTALKWKSSKAKVATVSSDGTVTAVKAGTATIAVMTSNKKVAKVKVKVEDPNAPTGVTLNQTGTVTLKPGETLQLTATLTPDTAQTTLKWKSSKKKVATISQSGLVTAKGTGTCTVGVVTANGKYAKVKIKVKK